MTIQAVLWDNDGILVDSETVFFDITRSVFAGIGLDLTKETWGKQYLGEGRGTHDIAISLGAAPEVVDAVIDKRNEDYRIALQQPPQLRPQVIETLSALSGHVKMGLVTGCHREQLHLMHSENKLLNFFDAIITADDYHEPKPSPVPYLKAMKAMDLKIENTVAVEDSKRGFLSAKAAGLACIVVPTDLTHMQNFSGALAVLDDVFSVVAHVLHNEGYDH